jgi:hypothetical protein
MKTALAFVCSLMLAWTNIVLAQALDASVASAASSCHCGKKTSCCAAKRSVPESLPVSTTPVSSFQNQFSPLAPATLAWALPAVPVRKSSPLISPSFETARTALFARNCAWLI